MTVGRAAEFANYLLSKNHIAGDVDARASVPTIEAQSALRKLWEQTNLGQRFC